MRRFVEISLYNVDYDTYCTYVNISVACRNINMIYYQYCILATGLGK